MPRIDEIFAFIADDEEGEGIVGFLAPNNQWIPLVGADMKRTEQFKQIAQGISTKTGKNIRLIHFSTRRDLEVISPEKKGGLP